MFQARYRRDAVKFWSALFLLGLILALGIWVIASNARGYTAPGTLQGFLSRGLVGYWDLMLALMVILWLTWRALNNLRWKEPALIVNDAGIFYHPRSTTAVIPWTNIREIGEFEWQYKTMFALHLRDASKYVSTGRRFSTLDKLVGLGHVQLTTFGTDGETDALRLALAAQAENHGIVMNRAT